MRKILSVLLSFVLLFSTLAVNLPVQAADSSVSKEVSGLLSALKIVPEGYNYQLNGNVKVTRQEFISLVMKTLKFENIKAEHTYFTDVDVDGSNTYFINCAVDMGLINGFGDGTFRPDEFISITDCLKIAIEACGYGAIAEQSGGYPTGYLKIASSEKFSKNLTGDYNAYAIMDDARIIIYNMLHAENVYGEKVLLNGMYNVYCGSGIVTGTEYTHLISENKLSEGCIEIGGEVYLQDDADYSYLLGYNVEFYYMLEAGEKILVYVSPSSKNSDIIYDAEDIADYSNRRYTFYSGTKKQYKAVPLTADIIYNGQVLLGDYDESILKPEKGSVTLIDNNGDGIYDVLKVINKRIIVVDSVDINEKIIYDRLTSSGITLKTQSSDYKITITNQFGVAIELKDITRNSVAEAEISLDGELVNIVVGDNAVSGVLYQKAQKKNKLLYKIDDTYYAVNYCLNSYINKKGLVYSVGKGYKFLLTTDKEIVWIDSVDDEAGNYGCLIKAGERKSLDSVLELKILTMEDKLEVFECADKIKINEQPGLDSIKAKGILTPMLSDSSTGAAVPLVIYYEKDSENRIKYIETPNGVSNKETDSLRLSGTAMNITTTKGAVSSVGGTVNFDKDTIMFMIPEDLENTADKDLRAVKINEYARDATVFKHIIGYTREPDGVISRVILNRETAGATYDWSIFMVTDVMEGINGEREIKYKIKGLLNGTETEYWIDDNETYTNPKPFAGSTSPNPPEKGDLLRLAIGPTGEIKNIAVVYSPLNNKWYIDQNPTGSGIPFLESPTDVENLENYYLRSPNGGHYRATLRVFEANVYSKNDTHIRAVNTMYDLADSDVVRMIENAEIGMENHQANSTNVFVYEADSRNGEVYQRGDIGSITSLKGQGNASRVVICTVESKPVAIIVYKKTK